MEQKNKISFTQEVYELVKQIPKGYVSTYSNVARALHTKAYRAVGNAMKKNPHAPGVPCHRVINSKGEIGGFAGGTRKKIQLLRKEGVEVKNGKIDLDKYFYKL